MFSEEIFCCVLYLLYTVIVGTFTCTFCSFTYYLAGDLAGEGIHQLFHAVVSENGRVEQEVFVRQLISVYVEAVGHQRVPVVQLAELQRDAVPVLELGVEQQRGVELQVQEVAAEVLHVLLDDDSYRLAWEVRER